MIRRLPWEVLFLFLLGVAAGLAYAWLFAPVQVTDATPAALRADFKDHYRLVIAAAYAANGDLARARARLQTLGETDPYASLSTQAQRALASGDRLGASQLAQLAIALQQNILTQPPSPTKDNLLSTGEPLPDTPSPPLILPSSHTPLPEYTPTPRPTRSPTPRPTLPFQVISQQTLCDETLPEGLLQVIVQTANQTPLPGIELILSWAGGEEHFFTGLKPELGNGYADILLRPETTYTLSVAGSSTLVTDLIAPLCKRPDGETYLGSIKVILQRP